MLWVLKRTVSFVKTGGNEKTILQFYAQMFCLSKPMHAILVCYLGGVIISLASPRTIYRAA